ncbi:MAG: glycosyltransferase [Caldilineaceae bacterium]
MMQPIPILYLDHADLGRGRGSADQSAQRDRPQPLSSAGGDARRRLLGRRFRRAGIEQAHVTFGRLNEAGILLPLHLARAVWQVAHLARKENAAIIHSNTVRTHIVGALVGALTGIPVVWTIHDNTFPPGLFRRLSAIPRRIIAVSGMVGGNLRRRCQPQCRRQDDGDPQRPASARDHNAARQHSAAWRTARRVGHSGAGAPDPERRQAGEGQSAPPLHRSGV